MVLDDERQFQPPDIAPLYPSVLDSCSSLTSPLKSQPQKVRRKYHHHHGKNGCVVQYGVSTNQIPGSVPIGGYQYDTQVIVKVSNHQEDKHLSTKNYNKRRRLLFEHSPSKMFIGKLTKNQRSWKDSSTKNHINEYYGKKIKTLGNMFPESVQKRGMNEEETSTRSDSISGNESSRNINTVAEVHKYENKQKRHEKTKFDNVEIMNEKNINTSQEEKSDSQKPEMSKFQKKKLKFTKIFTSGNKESRDNEIDNKDIEKAEEAILTKRKQSKISDEDKESDFSRIEEICEDSLSDKFIKNSHRTIVKSVHGNGQIENKSVGIQATPFPPFRLHFLPKDDWKETENKLHKVLKIVLSQCGLACIVLTWAMLGALVFRLTEGPQEQWQVKEMAQQQASLVVGLATDLRQVVPQEPIWRHTIERYADRHEALILSAVSSGYPQRGTIWTYPGSLLFATSLLTTLGFGAPVPRTVIGRMSAIIFAGLGIPMHLLLVLNIGLLLVVKLTRLANICSGKLKFLKFKIHKVKSRGDSEQKTKTEWPEELFVSERTTPPPWLKYFPLVAIPTYYLTGFLLFGVARGKKFPEVFLFPLDFTSAGGVASTYGHLRIAYALYLEGAVILASTNVALLRVSATRGFTTVAIKLGLMTNSLH